VERKETQQLYYNTVTKSWELGSSEAASDAASDAGSSEASSAGSSSTITMGGISRLGDRLFFSEETGTWMVRP
jgi:hypothetical protein